MRARLFSRTGETRGLDFTVGETATIGRGEDNEIQLPVVAVSTAHARLAWNADAGCYEIEDLDSLNGTEVDGLPVHGVQRLGRLNVVTLAGHDFVFIDLERSEGRGGRPRPAPAEDAEPEDSAAAPDDPQPSVTRIDVRPTVLPPNLGESARTDAEASGEGDSLRDLTEADGEALLLPLELARRAQALGGGEPEETKPKPESDGPGTERFTLDDLPALPKGLGGDKSKEAKPPSPTIDFLESGKSTLDELFLAGLAPSTGDEPSTAEDPPAEAASSEPEAPEEGPLVLDVVCGGEQLSFTLSDGEHAVGRSEDCSVRLLSPDLSRRHAVLSVSGDEVIVHDHGSRNGTFVAGYRVDGSAPVPVGARLRFGAVEGRLHRAQTPETPR